MIDPPLRHTALRIGISLAVFTKTIGGICAKREPHAEGTFQVKLVRRRVIEAIRCQRIAMPYAHQRIGHPRLVISGVCANCQLFMAATIFVDAPSQADGIKRALGDTFACAAADDITAWCILAAVIAIVKAGSFVSSLYIIGLAFVYVMTMIFVVKPFLKRIGDLYKTKNKLNKPVVAIFFLTLILSSYVTEVIGIHALFGAFMTGVIMPDISKFRAIFIDKVEDVLDALAKFQIPMPTLAEKWI